MRRPFSLLLLGALCAGAAGAAQSSRCTVPGDSIHWIADYCMASLETDDEIAAGECIGRETRRSFKTACAANTHYKKALCELSISRGHRPGSLERCLADRRFIGRTVRNRGVGGN